MEKLTIGDLNKIIKENDLPDDVVICYERIEDKYFDGYIFKNKHTPKEGMKMGGWKTIKIKDFPYYSMLTHVENLKKGELVKQGKLSEDELGEYYWHDDYKKSREKDNTNPDDFKSQYIEGLCCFYSKKENILCITAHI